MKKMIYCDLKRIEEGGAVYSFGVRTDNMTGEVFFYSEFKMLTILQQPKGETVFDTVPARVRVKYAKQFEDGDFSEKSVLRKRIK